MKKFIEYLLKISKKLEKAEFSELINKMSNKRKETLKNYVDKHRITKDYYIEFLSKRISVFMCTYSIFKGIYGIDVEGEGFRYNTNITTRNESYAICIPWEYSKLDKLKIIFLKIYMIIKDIKKDYKINDSEAEAYLFGYLVKSIVLDFIGLNGLREILSEVNKEEKIIKTTLNRDEEFKIIISSFGKYEDDIINNRASGVTISTKGIKKQVILIPRGKNRLIWNDIDILSHEIYHATRNTRGIIGDEVYLWDEDILLEYFDKSLPVLKFLVKNKL